MNMQEVLIVISTHQLTVIPSMCGDGSAATSRMADRDVTMSAEPGSGCTWTAYAHWPSIFIDGETEAQRDKSCPNLNPRMGLEPKSPKL